MRFWRKTASNCAITNLAPVDNELGQLPGLVDERQRGGMPPTSCHF
jgi:hypothetical protein